MYDQRHSYIYVIDDDETLMRSICFLMQSSGYKVKSLNSAESFLQIYNPRRLGCLILDVRMPYMSGLELQLNLIQKHINIPIIFISGYADIPMAVDTLKKGAYDFLTKPLNNQELLDSVNKVLKIEQKRRNTENERKKFEKNYAELTPREKEITQQIVAGMSIEQIAQSLSTHTSFVDLSCTTIFKKMDVNGIAALIALIVGYKEEG